jgi:hypothetical protein
VETALTHIIKLTIINELFFVCSGNMAFEDQFVLCRLLDVVVNTVCFMGKKRSSDDFSIFNDITLNVNGVILTNLITIRK